MGRCCFVPNCDTGYRSCKEKRSLFRVPGDETLLLKWRKAIPRKDRELSQKDFVCEKHFECDAIVRQWTDGLQTINLLHPRLKNGAVPTIFPGCPNYLTKITTKRRALVRHDEVPNKKRKIHNPKETLTSSNLENNEIHTQLSTEENSNNNIFNELWTNLLAVKLPDSNWTIKKIENNDGNNKLLTVFTLYPVNNVPKVGKQCVIDSTLNIRFFIFDIEINPTNLFSGELVSSTDINIEYIESIVKKFDEIQVCEGGPNFSKCPPSKIYSECSKPITSFEIWRHNKCPLIIDNRNHPLRQCKYCISLKNKMKITSLRKPQYRLRLKTINNTTKKNDLRRIRNRNYKRLYRIKIRCQKLKAELQQLQNKIAETDENKLTIDLDNTNIPQPQKILIKEIVRMSKYSCATSRRYSEDWLLYCLLLHIRSPAAYNLLSHNNILPLPSSSTIRRYLSMVNMKCGLDEKFFEAFKQKLATKKECQRHGTLLFDEMAVRKSLKVNVKTMQLHGIVDFGDDCEQAEKSDKIETADHALVFMFCPLSDNYAQPVAVYASKGATKGKLLACLLIKIIIELEKAGAIVDATICDGASTNRRMWKEFDVSGEYKKCKNKCIHPFDDKRYLYFISDVPHLFKCIRNRIYEKKYIQVPEGRVEWNYYKYVYNEDLKLSGNLKVCPRITHDHIYPSPMLKMRVKLATQIFSNSMAKGLTFYKNRGVVGLEQADVTIQFTQKLNALFDCLNRKYPGEGIRKASNDINIITDFQIWLDNWEALLVEKQIDKNEFLSSSTAEGLRVTLLSITDLVDYLLNQCNFRYVLTAKCNQDKLEQFFGIIRQAGSCNDHPSFATFLQLYRMLSTYKLIKPPVRGNCSVDTQFTTETLNMKNFKLIFCEKLHQRSNIELIKEKLAEIVNGDEHNSELYDSTFENELDENVSTSIGDCVLYYVVGFLCRKLAKSTSCETCKASLKVDDKFVENVVASLTNLKTKGGLTHPCLELFYLFKKCEASFLKHVTSKSVYQKTVEDSITLISDFKFACDLHKNDVLSHALHYFVSMRMRQYFKSEDQKEKSLFKEKKKLSKLQKT